MISTSSGFAALLTLGLFAGCHDGRLVVALGEPVAVTTAASTGLDAEPAQGGTENDGFFIRFQDFESVTVRLGGAVVLETGPGLADYDVWGNGLVRQVTVNVEATAPAAQRATLVAELYQRVLGRGWQYWSGNRPDVVGEVSAQRWQRCLDGYNDGYIADDYPVPGSAGFFGAHFERPSGRWKPRLSILFGCRLDDDGENPYIVHQFSITLGPPSASRASPERP